MKRKKLTKLLIYIFVFILIFSSFIKLTPSINVYAAAPFTGSEDATNRDDFNTYHDQCLYQIWSVCKALDYDYNQCMGVLGCFGCESTYPEQIECWTNGADTRFRMCNLPGSWDDPDDVQTYRDKYSSQFMDNHVDWSRGAAEGNDKTQYQGSGGTGDYWAGIGIGQFTGTRSELLCTWAKNNNCDWFDMTNQLIWCLTDEAEGGDSRSGAWQKYKEETKGKSVTECAHWWAANFEGCPQGKIGERETMATTLASEIPTNAGYDKDFGDDVVNKTGLTPAKSRTGIIDRSIYSTYLNKNLIYTQNSGETICADDKETEQKNQDVYKGQINKLQGNSDTSTNYCLYELFGFDVHWYRYLGEATVPVDLLDHIWSAVDQNKVKDLSISDIFYDTTYYVSCRVYPTRPYVLTTQDVDNGNTDPRVTALVSSWIKGYPYVWGSMSLETSKTITKLISILLSDKIGQEIKAVIEKIETTKIWDIAQPVVTIFLGFAMIFFIISLVGKGIKYAKGQGAFKDALERFLIGFFVLGFLFASVANPTAFNEIMYKLTNIVDTVFKESLTKELENDEVIGVNDSDLVVEAVLWKNAVFSPWVRGQFGDRQYDELYTQYDTNSDDKHKMPQSHQELPEQGTPEYDTADKLGTPYFDSAKYTGDVFVPIGGDVEVRNWAAYLYSCGSKYHIDTTLLTAQPADVVDLDPDEIPKYPIANTTAYDSKLMADTYRVIDAQYNISPQIFVNGNASSNYTDSHIPVYKFAKQGTIAVFNACLLIFFVPLIWLKYKNFILLLITTIKMIYFSILELFKEQTGFRPFIDSVKECFVGYLVASLKICIMLGLYNKLGDLGQDNGFFKVLIFIILSIVIIGFSWKDARHIVDNAKGNIKRVKQKL